MGMQQLVYYMYYLLENYNTDPSVKYLVDHREIYFIPVVNPDGYEYNHQTDPNGGGYWRKNRRNNGSGIYGVDLNRNYGPYAYWNSSNGGSSTDPSSETYRGTAPFSEPEVQAIRDFLMTKHIRNTLNYHTYGNDLIYPYGALSHETPDSLIFREFAADITTYNGYTYGTDLQTVGYSTRGNSDDYEYDGDIASTNGNIFAMTPEVGGFSDGFWPPQSRIYPLAEENLLPNLYYTWVAGEFVKLNNANFSQQYFNPGDNVEMLPEFKNKGLSTGYNINVELSSNSSYITVNNATASFDSIEARSTAQVSSPLTFTISPSTPIDTEIKLVVKSLIDGAEMSSDTVSIITGIPTYAFVDTTNNINNLWTITSTPTNPHWGITTSTYHSAPNSYTDSPTGNYADNATVTLTLTNSIDLSGYSNPRLTYWTKWDIENDWDYAQTKISTNNGSTWTPLQGLYTNPGVGSFQPNGEPLYDGTQLNWVKEEISLASYSSSQVKFKFELKSDINTNRDGWYLDDIGVIIYTAVPVELTSFTANSNESSVSLNWITSTETNNKGFEIQRCADDKTNGPKNWKTLGFIAGSGTSSESHNYSFVDKNPISGSSLYRLKQVDFNGTFRIYGPVSSSYMGVTEYSLQQNYPNPFNPSTVIKYSIPKAGFVSLKVYNVLGSEVASLVNGYMEAGNHEINFSTNISGKELGSGIYFYTIKAGNYTQTKKMVVLK